jgi:selenocysteine lyase/cysteine desulfurase
MTAATRRGLFGLAAGAGAALSAAPAFAGEASALGFTPRADARPDDEAYWAQVAGLYDKPEGFIQLENGHFGAMARPVRAAYERITEHVNRETTLYTRGAVNPDLQAARLEIAAFLGVSADEIVFTRGATESLQALIGGYNRLRPGDAVLYADLDYDAMQGCMEWLAHRRGVQVVRIDLPEPATRQNLIDAYEAAFRAHPNVRLALLTHLSHRTGLVPPVRQIADLARSRGIDVILDSGHALGQVDFQLTDLGVDFAGLNLHKWIGAPLGVGLIYVKKARIADIDPSMSEPPDSPRIDARVHTGTINFAAALAAVDAVRLHRAIGIAPKAARLRHLRDRWAEALRGRSGIEILTPQDPSLYAALTSFRLSGRTTMAQNAAIRRRLFETSRILTVERAGPAKGACVRVTPSLVNTSEEMDRLVAALRGFEA